VTIRVIRVAARYIRGISVIGVYDAGAVTNH